ncbi:thiosulfate dehydrogenase [quinone] large subunit [Saccharomonospora amisosensis]|uniref:Thiosulfate dehydrogenase [quinone] large subunit n=1 Tax=Saccharomonospora amisosensis TaxID=1128677 RepID=A0A7X5UQJ0_9PSEU|nr:DoxX family membrane protein [Saccharomonospora amisosensis]NIJ12300.1 thiosulfate dehydrogenase [quinone] large subunit [Saccharomonospora amisosensis]
MSVKDQPRIESMRIPGRDAAATAARHGAVMTTTAGKLTAVLRIATGFVFLWAFLDKIFGFGYATSAERAWINGGSPTRGFLSGVDVGPFDATLRSWAGSAWADWLFMAGLAGIGVVVTLGIGLRLSALAGTVMMLLMWAAEWPLDRVTASGEPSMSTNPVVDYHIVYALVLIVLAAVYAGNTWGLGRRWAHLPLVNRNRWLL